jgi:hypothetical protein
VAGRCWHQVCQVTARDFLWLLDEKIWGVTVEEICQLQSEKKIRLEVLPKNLGDNNQIEGTQ